MTRDTATILEEDLQPSPHSDLPACYWSLLQNCLMHRFFFWNSWNPDRYYGELYAMLQVVPRE